MMANLREEEGDEDGICVFWVCKERENKRKRKGGARQIQCKWQPKIFFIFLFFCLLGINELDQVYLGY